MAVLTVLTISVTVLLGIVLYLKKYYTYWEKKGLNYLEPEFFYGNTKELIKKQLHSSLQYQKIYNELKFKGYKHGGIYTYFKPIYIPVNMELIKGILQKDFSHFMNRTRLSDPETSPQASNLFSLEGTKWKNLRAKLTPTFTSGKMKMMFSTLVECTSGLNEMLQEHAVIQDAVDIKDILARFTTDIIGSCAFGLNCNSMKDTNSEFRQYGRKIFQPDIKKKIKFFTTLLLPTFINRKLSLLFLNEKKPNFFAKTVIDTVEYREKNNIFRKDFLHLLLQLKNLGNVTDDEQITSAKKNVQSALSMQEVIAQCVLFFIAGFETSSTAMTFALYELAQNQDIQDKLRKDIDAVLNRHGGKITYEAIMEMNYLDKVVNESLRKHPPAGNLSRVCNEAYKIPETNVTLEPGTEVRIPVLGIHHDPEYYPNPDVFDPERFTEENNARRPNYSFIPFGEGPRICIGFRFALLQTKVGLASLISNYRVTLNSKTVVPLKYDVNSLVTSAKDGIWLNIHKLE